MARSVEFNEEEAIKKAMEVFWKKGYKGASMRDLKGAMRISSSSLYNTIGDKRELFVKCIRNYTTTSIEDTLIYTKMKSPLKAITKFVNDSVDVIFTDKSCMAVKTTFEIASTDTDVKTMLKESSIYSEKFLTDLIQKAIDQQEISADVNAEASALVIINAFTGWHESYILHQDPIKIKKMAQHMISQLSK